MSKNIWTAIIVIIVLGLGVWLFSTTQNQTNPTDNRDVVVPSNSPQSTAEGTQSADMIGENMVVISATGYSPFQITIKAGDTVTWVNSDSKLHTVNSDPHPAHSTYPGLNDVSNLRAGEKKSYTFSEAGIYKYHDHLNPELTGTVIVE